MTVVDLDALEQALSLEELEQHEQYEACLSHPAELGRHVECLDTETGEEFHFQLWDPGSGWYWQRELLDEWLGSPKHIVLKARQLGITWLAGLLALYHLLFRPGTNVLCVSINQTEANKVAGRIWLMYQSLPVHLRGHVEVIKPARGAEPSDTIEFRHPGGKKSKLLALPSTPRAGRGETAALVILDEFAAQEYARQTWTAVLPTVNKGGIMLVISTGNGVSTVDGQGNFYHFLWKNREDMRLHSRFLNVFTHPVRDQKWYEESAAGLPPAERGQEYPRTEREAFILTGDPYFDPDDLAFYDEKRVREPLFRGVFEREGISRTSVFAKREFGASRVFEKADSAHTYAIAADVATGRGSDYSAAYVIDLQTMAPVCELQAKIPADIYAEQLYCLALYYGTGTGCDTDAIIAVEDAGGWGESIIISLRERKPWRPAFNRLYQDEDEAQWGVPERRKFGYPVNQKNRGQILKELSAALREHSIPYLSAGCLEEMQTFVHRNTNPSPRAQEGCNDDRVMSLAVACDLYRKYGGMPRERTRRQPVASRPWERKRKSRMAV